MSPGVVLIAGQSENNSAAAMVAEAPDSGGKCILLYAPLVAEAPRSPLSPETDDQCTALIATLRQGGRA
jgi:hypothetical protein